MRKVCVNDSLDAITVQGEVQDGVTKPGLLRRAGGGAGRALGLAWRLALVLVFVGLGLVVGTFLNFAHTVRSSAPPVLADPLPGGVVLTGGPNRIDAGLELLMQGRVKRLLVSGVNPNTSAAALERVSENAEAAKLLECCVDLGREAKDTVGNAAETRDWAAARNLDRLLVVTADYHMPRALLELRAALPEVEMIAYPVPTPLVRADGWYGDPAALRRLIGEWGKLVSAQSRGWFGDEVMKRLFPRA